MRSFNENKKTSLCNSVCGMCLWVPGSRAAVLWATLTSVPSASLLPTHPSPPSGLTLTTLTSPKPRSITCGLPLYRVSFLEIHTSGPHIWPGPALASRVHHVVQKRRICSLRKGQPHLIHHAHSWTGQREKCSEAVLQGKGSAQRKDKDGLPGWGVDTSYTARRNIWPLGHMGEPECFCLHVSAQLAEWVCVFAFMFSFFLYLLCEVHLFD